MIKGRSSGIISGLLGALGIYMGLVGHDQHPGLLAMGLLLLLICLQSFSGASEEACAWMASALAAVTSVYGLLEIWTRRPEEGWAFLISAGLLLVALIVLFTIAHAKGYRWRREGAKTSPPGGERPRTD